MKKVIFYLLSIFVLLLVKTYAAAEERILGSSKCKALEPSIYLSADDLEFKIPAAFSEKIHYSNYFSFDDGHYLRMNEYLYSDEKNKNDNAKEMHDKYRNSHLKYLNMPLSKEYVTRSGKTVYVVIGRNPYRGSYESDSKNQNIIMLDSYIDFGGGYVNIWSKFKCGESYDSDRLQADYCLDSAMNGFLLWVETFLSAYEWIGNKRVESKSKYRTRYGLINVTGIKNRPLYNIEIFPTNCGILSALTIDNRYRGQNIGEWSESILGGDLENIHLHNDMLPPIIIVYSRMINGRAGIETIQFNRQDFALLLIWTEIPTKGYSKNTYLTTCMYAGLPMEVENNTFDPESSFKLWESVLNFSAL
ncbi:hypothetical protein C4J81_13290 [Deltaproteobacteria bacterium Smac51]|nr:hypothetical protein C4J81_13290 [Deltaproteobacteria bacterium Smac51]